MATPPTGAYGHKRKGTGIPDIGKVWQPLRGSPLDPSPSAYLNKKLTLPQDPHSRERPTFLTRTSIFGKRLSSPTSSTPESATRIVITPSLKRVDERFLSGKSTPATGFIVTPMSVGSNATTPDLRKPTLYRRSSTWSMRSARTQPDMWEDEGNQVDGASYQSGRSSTHLGAKSAQHLPKPSNLKFKDDEPDNIYSFVPTMNEPANATKFAAARKIPLSSKAKFPIRKPGSTDNLERSTVSSMSEEAEVMSYISPDNVKESPKDILYCINLHDAQDSLIYGLADSRSPIPAYAGVFASQNFSLAKDREQFSPSALLKDYFQVENPEAVSIVQPPAAQVYSNAPRHSTSSTDSVKAEPGSAASRCPHKDVMHDISSQWPLAPLKTHQRLSITPSTEIFAQAPIEPSDFKRMSRKLTLMSAKVVFSQAPSEPSSSARRSLELPEVLATIFACSTYGLLRYLLQHMDEPISWENLSSQFLLSSGTGVIISLAAYKFLGGRVKDVLQSILCGVGHLLGNLIAALIEGYRRVREH